MVIYQFQNIQILVHTVPIHGVVHGMEKDVLNLSERRYHYDSKSNIVR